VILEARIEYNDVCEDTIIITLSDIIDCYNYDKNKNMGAVDSVCRLEWGVLDVLGSPLHYRGIVFLRLKL
jgi:hypothetical protein